MNHFRERLAKALVVDDEATSALLLQSLLRIYDVSADICEGPDAMFRAMNSGEYGLVFLDYRLGRENGLEALRKVVREHPLVKVIMITAHGSIDLAVQAMQLGASGFIVKPFDESRIQHELKRAMRSTRSMAASGSNSFLVGDSPAMNRIFEQIQRMKDVETTVLITGESGTGKELVARSLHDQSCRAKNRFEAINCAAIPENLLESELFGHRRGAFTDAKSDRKGLFEQCHDGTLFLDEIGEMALPLQAKLLRALQEKVIMPLGSTSGIKVNTRIIAATNQNLAALVKEGKFRKDLYYRLSILQIETPPLRDRPEDIAPLVLHFVHQIAKRFGREIESPSSELMARLQAYTWPGNVRELQNSLERAIVLSVDGELRAEDIFSSADVAPSGDVADIGAIKDLTLAKEDFEKRYLERVLAATKGNVSEASRISGRMRTDMYRLFGKHQIDPASFK